MEVSFTLARAQPGKVLTLHAAHVVGIDAELLDPVLPGVRGWRVHREAEPAGVALVIRRCQDDGGRVLAQLVGNGERIEQHEVVAELDPVGRDELGPPLLLVPVGMRRLPMPDTGPQLTHGHSLHAGFWFNNEPIAAQWPGRVGCYSTSVAATTADHAPRSPSEEIRRASDAEHPSVSHCAISLGMLPIAERPGSTLFSLTNRPQFGQTLGSAFSPSTIRPAADLP